MRHNGRHQIRQQTLFEKCSSGDVDVDENTGRSQTDRGIGSAKRLQSLPKVMRLFKVMFADIFIVEWIELVLTGFGYSRIEVW